MPAGRATIVDEPGVTIELVERVPERLRPAAEAIAASSFRPPSGTDADGHDRADQFCSQNDVIGWVLALRGGELVGLTALYRRTIDFKGQPLVLGGIGDVFVVTEHRQQGIATRLTLASVQALADAGCDVAYLCANLERPHIVRLYGQGGFVPLGRAQTFIGASGRRYVDHDAMIAPVRSPELFEAIMRDSEPFDLGGGNW